MCRDFIDTRSRARGQAKAVVMSQVLIADEQSLSRDGLKLLIGQLCPDAPTSEAESLDEALQVIARNGAFRLIFLSVTLPGSQQFGGLKQVLEAAPSAPVILLTSTHDDGNIVKALRQGARGYMLRSSSREVLRLAVSLVLAGETYIPTDAIAGIEMQHALGDALGDAQPGKNPIHSLSKRQMQVLQHMIDGHPNKVIAGKLGLRETTVKTHVKAIMHKLEVHNRTQAVLNALRYGCRPAKLVDD